MAKSAKRFSRKELYELVWTEPMKTLAGRLGISDVALKKSCEQAAIPTPDRGYWAKKEAGKETIQVALSERPLSMDEEIVVAGGRDYWYRDWTEAELLGPLPAKPEFQEPIESVRQRVSRTIGAVKVPRVVQSWHSQIERLFKADEQRRAKQEASSYPSLWDGPIFDTPFEQRRLRILNTLSFAVAKFNGKISISGREGRSVCFSFYRQHIHIRLDEPTRVLRYDGMFTTSKPDKNSKLVFCVLRGPMSEDTLARWEDGDAGNIEMRLGEIAVALVVTAESECRESAFRQYEWRVTRKARLEEEILQRKIQAERAEKERLELSEQARIDRLLKDARNFEIANQLRGYVEAVGKLESPRRAEYERWRSWALAQADRIDPVTSRSFADAMDDIQNR